MTENISLKYTMRMEGGEHGGLCSSTSKVRLTESCDHRFMSHSGFLNFVLVWGQQIMFWYDQNLRVFFFQLQCHLSSWSLSVCPRVWRGCPAPRKETVLSSAGRWTETHWQMISSSLETTRLMRSTWKQQCQDNWCVQSATTWAKPLEQKWFQPVVSGERLHSCPIDVWGLRRFFHFRLRFHSAPITKWDKHNTVGICNNNKTNQNIWHYTRWSTAHW